MYENDYEISMEIFQYMKCNISFMDLYYII